MKTCVIFYHSGITKIYKTEWIEKCINSILEQTYKDFYVYELNYGKDNINFSLYFSHLGERYKYFKVEQPNHAYAINFLLDECKKDKFSAVFNTNLDDYYHPERFQKQIEKIKQGYDLVSSNMQYVRDEQLAEHYKFHIHQDNIEGIIENENIIVHPVVCYGKKFISKLRYNPDDIPEEDYTLWKKIYKDYKIFILEDTLCYYRRHDNQITKVEKQEVNNIKKINYNKKKIIELCRCGGQVSTIISPYGNRYKICQSCKKNY